MSTFGLLATASATTQRATIAGGSGSGLANNLSAFAIVPLMPVDAEVRARLNLRGFAELKETFVETGLDIKEGDFLVVGGTGYPVRAVEEWPWADSTTFLRVVVEELKR